MTSNAAALPLPGWRDPLDKILKRLADGLGPTPQPAWKSWKHA